MNEKKELYKKLFTIVTPIAFQYLMASLVSASDAFMLGFLDQDALSRHHRLPDRQHLYTVYFTEHLFSDAMSLLLSTGERKTTGQLKKHWPLL